MEQTCTCLQWKEKRSIKIAKRWRGIRTRCGRSKSYLTNGLFPEAMDDTIKIWDGEKVRE